MNGIKIKDIYAGKPDAKDEINFEGVEEFLEAFVVPRNFDLNALCNGNKFFITGYKGVGKTALLFYLDRLLRNGDEATCTSFIFFKEEFTDLKKSQLDRFSKRLLASIYIENETLVNNSEFEYIWRWIFFKKLVEDNETFSDGIFVNDRNWSEFVKTVKSIHGPGTSKKYIIPSKLKVAMPISDKVAGTEVSPEINIDLNSKNEEGNLDKFIELVTLAETLLGKVKKTDIPYYLFVDELEAYFGDEQIFHRDLCLIRDMIFTIKRINSIFASAEMSNIKIICSIRTEIVNSISRNIVTKEMNKVVSGFEVPLRWNYNNTNSFSHPILQILLRRIFISEHNNGKRTEKELISDWFPDNIHEIDTASYILNNSWCKPRDIVRLITAAKGSLENESEKFSTAVFLALRKQYSLDSLEEIKEELRALYSTEDIEMIINCFNGFKSCMSVNELKERVEQLFKDTVLDKHFIQVLQDLYRVGIIGNCIPRLNMYRWNYKGDDGIIISDEWKIVVHQGLQAALSLGRRQDHYFQSKQPPRIGNIVNVTIESLNKSFLNISFLHYGKKQLGYIHISEISDKYIENLQDLFSAGDSLEAKIIEYDKKYSKWALSLIEIPQKEQSVKKVVERDNNEILSNCRNGLEFQKNNDEAKETVDRNYMREIHCWLEEANIKYQNEEGFTDISAAGSYIKRHKPDFNIKNLGYAKLSKLIEDFPERYITKKNRGKGNTENKVYKSIN